MFRPSPRLTKRRLSYTYPQVAAIARSMDPRANGAPCWLTGEATRLSHGFSSGFQYAAPAQREHSTWVLLRRNVSMLKWATADLRETLVLKPLPTNRGSVG